MTYKEAVKQFKKSLKEGEYDYWTVQLMWAEYTDGMCKAGEITQKQWRNWATPFEYGKRIFVRNNKVVTQKEGE